MSEELTPVDRMELWMSALNEAITNGTENTFMPYNRYELWMKKLCEAILAKDPADPDVVQAFVEDWLDAHPEATTTVEDGAVTTAKLASSAVTRAKVADAALADIAGEYSSSATYAVGDYVFHSGALYRCISAITTAEAWTAAHWTAVALGNDVAVLNNTIVDISKLQSTTEKPTGFDQGYRHERTNASLVNNAKWVCLTNPFNFIAGQIVSVASGYEYTVIDSNTSNNGAYLVTRRSTAYTFTEDKSGYIEVRVSGGSTNITPSDVSGIVVTVTTPYPIVSTVNNVKSKTDKIRKFVAITGSDDNDGNTASTPYATIGKALTETADEIYIKPGTYAENLGEVNTAYRYRNVKIIGDHAVLQSNATLHFRFCNVEIVGITFDHQATSGEAAGLQLYNCTGHISDCYVKNAPGNGFRFDGSKLTVERCVAENCGIDGFNGHTLTTGYETEVTLIDCIAYGCGDDGASIHESGKMYVYGGEYYNNTQAGLAPHDYCEFEAFNVHCHHNDIGIEAVKDESTETPGNGRIIGCILHDNTTYGIYAKNYNVSTLGNGYANNGSGKTEAGSGATITEYVAE